MPVMKSLNIAVEEPRNHQDPFSKAKSRLLSNLQLQLKAAEAMVAGEIYMVTRPQKVEENGEMVRKHVKRPIRHWYWRDSTGAVRFAVRVSNKRLELSKGKTDIIVGEDTALPGIITQVIDAVKAGELDKAIEGALQKRKAS